MTHHDRRGLTLIELLISVVVAAIIGAGMISLMLSANRFDELTESQRGARRVSRAAINALTTDLRMVDPGWGIELASASSVTVRIPYAMGVICSSTATTQVIALLPVDSVAFASPGYSGFAVRGGSVTDVFTGGTLTESGSWPAACTTAGVVQIAGTAAAPNARTRAVTITLPGTGVGTPRDVGEAVMLFRRVRYYFGTSGQTGLTGRTGLWRHHLNAGGAAEELAAPFDATAAFAFYVNDAAASTGTAPVTLSDLTGLELILPGESDRAPRLRNAPAEAPLRTSIFFVNRTS